MKQKFFTLFLLIISMFGMISNVNAVTVTANAVTGNWSAIGSWSGGAVPTYNDDVVIPSGATITIDGTYPTCKTITVQNGGIAILNPTTGFYVGSIFVNNGGKFYGTGSYSSGNKSMFLGVLNTNASISSLTYTAQTGDFYITVDGTGQFGGTVAGTNDGIQIFFGELATSYTIDGTSTTTKYISRLMANNLVDQSTSTNFNFNIKQNLQITMQNAGIGFSLQNNKKFVGSRTLTIFPGYKVTCNGNARFHGNAGAPSASQGDFTYNIYGTLDLGTYNANFDIYSTSFSANTHTITLNLGDGTNYAVLKLGRTISLKKYFSGQSIVMNWNNPNSKVILAGNNTYTLSCQSAIATTQTTTATGITNSSPTVTLSASNASIKVGQTVTGTGIAANSYVAGISGTTLTLNQNGASNIASASTLYFGTENFSNFPAQIRSLSYENSVANGGWSMPVKTNVTDSLIMPGVGGKMYVGFPGSSTVITALDKIVYNTNNNNAYKVTTVGSAATTTSAQLDAAGTWVSGATLTDANGNQFYCEPNPLSCGNIYITSGTPSGAEISGTPVSVTGNIVSNISGVSNYFRLNTPTTVSGSVTNNGTGILYVGQTSTIGSLVNTAGGIVQVANYKTLTTGNVNNSTAQGVINLGSSSTIALSGNVSGAGTINANLGTLYVKGSSEQSLSADNLYGTVNYLLIGAGSKLTSTGAITATTLKLSSNNAGATGTLINNGTMNATTTISEQYLSTTRNWYISSPVTNALAPSGYTYYRYNESAANWTSSPVAVGDQLEKGVGYIALPGSTGSILTFTTQAGGTLNTGDVDITLSRSGATKTGFNLIGNPYPCHLTWTKTFVDANAAKIQPTIWYRTNAGSVNSGGDASWSFKTYNSSTNEASPMGTTNIIPPMQAFWVRAVAAGTLTLNSDLTKSHQSSNPLKAPAQNTERKRLRLEISNGSVSDETLIYFDTQASDNFDNFDSPKMFVSSSARPEIYTSVGSDEMVINGMNSYNFGTVIPLGVNLGEAKTYTLSAIQLENFDADTRIMLKDNITNAETDLTAGETYTFTSDATATNTRFSVIFKSASGSTEVSNQLTGWTVYGSNNEILIDSKQKLAENAHVKVYNSTGQLIHDGSITGQLTRINGNFLSGSYIVKVENGNQYITNKIIL